MKDALLEIGVENLPARFIGPALSQLGELAKDELRQERLSFDAVKTYGTPRRLALHLVGVAEKSQPLEETTTGPSIKVWKDAEGRFTPQAEGFARSRGVRPEELRPVLTPKGEFLQARKVVAGKPAVKVLQEMFPRLIGRLQFPKSLEWEESRFRFGRPIRNLLALYGKKTVPFALAGVRSGNKVLGLAAAGSKPVRIPEPSRYLPILKDRCVLADVAARREALSKALDEAVRKTGGRLDKDAALLEEIVFLTEHPVPVVGGFDKSFLELPPALLATVLKSQLKFFPLLGAEGRLEPGFVGVRDGVSEGQSLVRNGYERVIEARFNDARFFHRRDLASRLEEKLERLKKVTFQRGLGSLHDKMERTSALAQWTFEHISPRIDLEKLSLKDLDAVKRIARLAYADLVTEVVREFPELQGIMGGHYARKDAEDEKVAMGLEEFYFPVGPKAPLPNRLEACIASLAGKLDTMAALFLAGNRPTGSEDPFALRRLGTGVARIVLEKQLPLDLKDSVIQAFAGVKAGLAESKDGARETLDCCEFLWQRAETLFSDMGYPLDEVRAVADGALADLPRAYKRLASLHAMRPNPEFGELAAAFKRAANILKQAGDGAVPLDAGLLSVDAERALHQAMGSIAEALEVQTGEGRFDEALRLLVNLKPAVDRFFDDVLVMDKDERVRKNRLALLAELVRLFKSVADISHIQPSSTI